MLQCTSCNNKEMSCFIDRGNDNWLIKYEKIPEVDRQVQGDQGVKLIQIMCASLIQSNL